MKTIDITWDIIHKDSLVLSLMLPPGRFTYIVAVTRGGLVPAAIISHVLNIQYVDTACIASYKDTKRGKLDFMKYPSVTNTPDVLIIDDLVDTGNTARAIQMYLPNTYYAAIYAKPMGMELVNSFVTEIPQDTWVNFPWGD